MKDLHKQQHDQSVTKRQGGHTPGPWEADGFVIDSEFLTLTAVNLDAVDLDGNRISPMEAHANAQLIAAAPDLLEAAQGLVEMFDREQYRVHDSEGLIQYDPLWFLEGAIAKATGVKRTASSFSATKEEK
jgi:predicted membrane-bound mannosyltransferase